MDEERAWDNFIASGSIRDYLIYKEVKACTGQNLHAGKTEDADEVQNRWSYTDRTNNQGK